MYTFDFDVIIPDQEQCSGKNGAGYRGTQSTTKLGKTCKNWVDTAFSTNLLVADNGETSLALEANYCRNPALKSD